MISLSRKTGIKHTFTLQESKVDEGKKEIELVVIKSGLSQRKNYYPAQVLKEAAPLFSGVKMYMDHQSPDKVGVEARSFRDWIGTIKESWYVGDERNGQIVARAAIRNPEFWNIVLEASKGGYLDEIGISIDALAAARIGSDPETGQTAQLVESIKKPRSVDAVTMASAGGSISEVFESAIAEEVTELDKLNEMTLEELIDARPDLIKEIYEAALEEVVDEEEDTEDLTEEDVQSLLDAGYEIDEDGELWSPEELDELENMIAEEGYYVDEDGELAPIIDPDEMVADDDDEDYEEGITYESAIFDASDAEDFVSQGYNLALRDLQESQDGVIDAINSGEKDRQIADLQDKVAYLTEALVSVSDDTTSLRNEQLAVKMLRESGLPGVSKRKLMPYLLTQESAQEMAELIAEERLYLEEIDPTMVHDPIIHESAIESDMEEAQGRLDSVIGD